MVADTRNKAVVDTAEEKVEEPCSLMNWNSEKMKLVGVFEIENDLAHNY